MFDLRKQKVDVSCSCGRRHSATLQDITNRRKIRCGCGVIIQLTDNSGSVRKSVSDINKNMRNLEKMFKRLGK